MALPAIGDGEQVGDGNTNETLLVGRSGQSLQIGGATTTLIGFYGETPVDQGATVTSVTTTAATSTTNAFGYSTSTQADGIVTAVNALITRLQDIGIIA